MMLDDSDFVVSLLFCCCMVYWPFLYRHHLSNFNEKSATGSGFLGGGAKAAEERARCGLIVWREGERKKENNIPVMVK